MVIVEKLIPSNVIINISADNHYDNRGKNILIQKSVSKYKVAMRIKDSFADGVLLQKGC